jgi:hypothetical protein
MRMTQRLLYGDLVVQIVSWLCNEEEECLRFPTVWKINNWFATQRVMQGSEQSRNGHSNGSLGHQGPNLVTYCLVLLAESVILIWWWHPTISVSFQRRKTEIKIKLRVGLEPSTFASVSDMACALGHSVLMECCWSYLYLYQFWWCNFRH